MTPERRVVCNRVLAYGTLADMACAPRGPDRWLVLGLIAQESQGEPYTWRYEPNFWSQRKGTIIRELTRTHPAWLPHGRLTAEDFDAACDRRAAVLAASYGLAQVMLITAVELGVPLAYPTSLCEPATGIAAGVAYLRHCFDQVPKTETQPIRAALLAYNGGGDPTYDDKVLAWRDDCMETARG